MERRLSITARRILVVSVIASIVPAIPAGATRNARSVETSISAAVRVVPHLDGTLDVEYLDQQQVVREGDATEVVRKLAPVPQDDEPVEVAICFDEKWNGQDPNRITYPPVPIAADAGVGHVQYIFSLFRLEYARRYLNVWQRQFEACSRGLAQSDAEHWKLLEGGAAEADINPERFTRIGWNYRSGPTPPKYSLSYGFAHGSDLCAGVPAAKACSDSSVSASVTQTKSGQLLGGFKGPQGSLQPYWKNGVAGWWDGSEIGGVQAFQSQGTVVHSLWEYPMDDAYGVEPPLYGEVFADFSCERWLGLGCSLPRPSIGRGRVR